MEFKLKNKQLIDLDAKVFSLNKMYSMALSSLGKLPNIYALKEITKKINSIKEGLSKIKTEDEFEKLVVENYLLNLESQRVYLEYFTTAGKENLEETLKILLGENSIKIIEEQAKNFDYESFWNFYLSYQDYTYRSIPQDDESQREKLKEILKNLKKDILEYAEKNFNFPKKYEFDLILGQPYSKQTYFHPTTKRMEVSPSKFLIYKDNNEIKINTNNVIEVLFHELIGHGRHEINSTNLPLALQDSSINLVTTSAHVHAEGVSQITRKDAIEFMKLHKEKYLLEDDYIKQSELAEVSDSANSLLITFQYLQLKNLEDSSFNIEKEYKKITNNHGLFILYSTIDKSPLSCVKNATYLIGLHNMKELLKSIEKEYGKDYFKKNHSIINQAISTGLWHFKVLPKFVRLFLNSNHK